MKPLFPLGQVVATPWALETLEALGVEPLDLINRHVSGDWSDMAQENQHRNIRHSEAIIYPKPMIHSD